MKKLFYLVLLLTSVSCGRQLAAQTLLSDDFESDTSANWVLFQESSNGISDYTATFGFDYTSFRYVSGGVTNTIPPAPNSAAGIPTVRGLKLTVNKDDVAATAAVSLYPKDKQFSGQFALRFDMWLNYNGPAFGGV